MRGRDYHAAVDLITKVLEVHSEVTKETFSLYVYIMYLCNSQVVQFL